MADVGAEAGRGGQTARLVPVEEDLPEAEGRTLRVTIEGASTGGEVLVVPVTAVHSEADGSSYVRVVHGGEERRVPISTGLSAGGHVEIQAEAGHVVSPGDRVVVGVERRGSDTAGEP